MKPNKRILVDSDDGDTNSSLDSEEDEIIGDESLSDNEESDNDYDSRDDEDVDLVNEGEEISSSSIDSDGNNDTGDEEESDKNEEGDDDDDYQDSEDNASACEEMEVDVQDEIENGNGIIAQSKMYNGLLSCRMKAQEALAAMNQLPQGDDFKCLSSSGMMFEETIADTQSVIQKTLLNLVKLQNKLLSCRNDTKFIATMNLPSGGEKTETERDCDNLTSVAKIQEFLSDSHRLLNKFRDETLEKVENGEAAQSVQNSFKNFESSAIGQIKTVLLDKDRLIRRTQLIRSSLPIIGRKDFEEVDDEKSSARQKYNCEIFDDSDFYNKLLTQHVSLKTANLTDMTAISKEWAELSSLKKNKIAVDRKASKGRKLRYTVHRKLINFVTPVHLETLYSDEQRDALAREVFRGQS